MMICIETEIQAPIDQVWKAWTTPEDIVCWNFAIDEWCCPKAEINLIAGGQFRYRMEAKDGSMGFDFTGEFIQLEPRRRIHYRLEDHRAVTVEFIETKEGTKVIETFEVEDENTAEQQREGWQSILINFKRYVEQKVS